RSESEKRIMKRFAALLGLFGLLLAGPFLVGDDKKADVLEIPYILWGGDVATYHANGGAETQEGSLFARQGLNVKLVRNDDFDKQVKDYLDGKSPFLRGTMSMLGQAADAICKDPKTRPVIFLQLTWSAGDHMVSRPTCKTLNDLKGKKVTLQKGGPHVGMLDDILRTANLKWKDITPVWTNDVTGKDGPAELFRNDQTVDCCFVVSPDMQGLTGGLEQKGTGRENTVKDAFVLVSTVTMKRSIADIYAVRKDFFDANKAMIEKLAAGYLKGCEEILEWRANPKDKTARTKFQAGLKMACDLVRHREGEAALENEAEAAGFVNDAHFVGLPGNQAFFHEKGNPSGFEAKMMHALDLAVGERYAEQRADFLPADFDYRKIGGLGGLKADPNQGRTEFTGKEELGDPIFTFVV